MAFRYLATLRRLALTLRRVAKRSRDSAYRNSVNGGRNRCFCPGEGPNEVTQSSPGSVLGACVSWLFSYAVFRNQQRPYGAF